MAFCTKCGKALADGEKCTCETPVATEQTPQTETATAAPKKKNTGLIAGIAAIAIVVVIVLVMVLSAKPHMEPVNDFIAAINKKNTNYIELYETLMPDFAVKPLNKLYKQMLNNEDTADYYEEKSEYYAECYEDATDEFNKWKLSFELKKETLLEDEEFENVQDNIEHYYRNKLDDTVDYYEDLLDDDDAFEDFADNNDISEKQAKSLIDAAIKYYNTYKDVEVTEAYEIKGKFIIKADGEEYDTDTVKFYVAKVNGDWVYYSFREGNVYFDGDASGFFSFVSDILSSGKYCYRP